MRAVASLLIVALSVVGFALPVSAKTVAQAKVEAAAASAKLDDLRNKAEVAAEDFNQARAEYETVAAKVRSTQAKIVSLTAQQGRLQAALGNRADEMYRSDGTLGVIEMLLSAQSIDDFNSIVEMLTRVSEQDASTVAKLKATREQLTVQRATLQTAQAEALARSDAMKTKSDQAKASVAAAQTLLNGLNSQIKTLIAQQKAAEEAAARARWRQQQQQQQQQQDANSGSSGGSSGGSSASDPGGNPPTSSKGAAAVYWAKRALGSWYQWGAAGPDRFDCSGLMLWAYRHVGISLPHYSGAQYNSGPHVSRGNLQPGDLLFFGSPIHHVGMYIGGGEFIEAPYTGARVRIASLDGRGDYVGATRP